ncbi:PAS domain S-box protein [Salinigranum salinum]|uniref:PAS domain S-box protein n=1 Tax=Salinigranum salinum TaxID=1364937 RepID=UPI00126114EA|nr:PAS domain S-box protein [Salinigranum salinum]
MTARTGASSTVASQTTIRTLHVDDDPAFGELTAEFLELNESRISVVAETSASDGLERLATDDIDCVVSDYDMPGTNGIEFLEAVRADYPDLPFILFTGKGSEEIASDAVSAGVTDYLQKEHGTDQYTILANRIVNVTERHWAEADLERRTDQHGAVATLGQRALETADLAALFDEAVRLVADRLGTGYAKLLERSEEGGELALVAGVGWDEGLVGTATVSAGADSQAGYTLTSTDPVVVTDLETETRFDGPKLLVDHGIESGISVVVGSADDPWGVLGAHSTDRREFTDHDVTFVRSVANVLGAAIHRRNAEERVRESEARFREIAELSPDGIFRTDTDGVFTYVSPASEALLGRSADELVGSRFDRLVAAESVETAAEGIGRVVGGEIVRGLALTLVDADGEPFDVEVSASPVRRADEVALVQGFARDVTERNERERQLQRSRERYRALVDHFPNGGVFLFDDDLRYTTVGGDELASVGLSPEAMVGKTPRQVFPPENAATLEPHYRAALAGEKRSFEDAWQGSHYHVQTIPLRNVDGDVISGMAVAQNITERVERERELQQRRERYRTLVDNFPGGVFRFDHDLRISAAGGAELERAGWDPAELEGRTIYEVLSPDGIEPLEPHYRATLDGEARSFEYEWEGSHYHVQTVPLRDADGEVTTGMSVAQNVTERIEHERKLDQLRQRSRALMHTTTMDETARIAVDAASEIIGAPLSGFHVLNEAGDALEPGVMAESVDDLFEAPPSYPKDAEPGSRAAVVWEAFERGVSLHIPDTDAYEPLDESTPAGSVLIHTVGDHGVFVVSAPEPNAYDETDRALVDILVDSLGAAMDRVEREQRLRRREHRLERQNKRLSRFVDIVSHDLRSPLNVAAGHLRLARETNQPDHLDSIEVAHDRIYELVESLLRLARGGETVAEATAVDLAAAARASWRTVETPRARLVVDTDRVVLADESRLRQVLENLFRNAVEHGSTTHRSHARDDSVEHGSTNSRLEADTAGESGGTGSSAPDRETRGRPKSTNGGATTDDPLTDGSPAEVAVTVTVGDLEGGFYVEDDGPGIPAAERERVLEVGYSRADDGIGFGLGIVEEIAAEHGWALTITDGTAGGARFELTGVDTA